VDPVTHAMIGLGVSALSGQPLSPYNPLYCAAVVGAVAPDLDVLTMLKGELAFIRHHRGVSHSLGGFLLFSAAIAVIIHLDFGGNPWPYFLWALAGTISHGILDFLNSYGTQLWWPFSKKRLAGNLLMFFDPLLFMFFLPVLLTFQNPQKATVFGLLGTFFYLLLRWKMRLKVERLLQKEYNLNPVKGRIAVMPALKGMVNWDFFIEGPREIIVGTLNFLNRKISNCRHMDRKASSPLIFKALQTAPGRLFCQFTSYYHITQWEDKGKHFVTLMDLRFKHQSDFFYRAMLIFDEQLLLEEAYFYSQNNLIPMDIG
jgi:inner membrane protein